MLESIGLLFDEIENFSNWTLPEWLSVIGGLGTVCLVGKWVLDRIRNFLSSLLTLTGRLSLKMVILGLESEFMRLTQLADLAFVFEKHPSVCVVYVSILFLRIISIILMAGIVFIGAPDPIDMVLSAIILLLAFSAASISRKELVFFMYAEKRIKKLKTKYEALTDSFSAIDDETIEHIEKRKTELEEFLAIGKRMDVRRWNSPADGEADTSPKLENKATEE